MLLVRNCFKNSHLFQKFGDHSDFFMKQHSENSCLIFRDNCFKFHGIHFFLSPFIFSVVHLFSCLLFIVPVERVRFMKTGKCFRFKFKSHGRKTKPNFYDTFQSKLPFQLLDSITKIHFDCDASK